MIRNESNEEPDENEEEWIFENIIFLCKEKMQTTFIKATEIVNKYKNESEHDSIVLYLDNENKKENNFN